MQHKYEKDQFLKMQYDQYLKNIQIFNRNDPFMTQRESKVTSKTMYSVESLDELNKDSKVSIDCVKSKLYRKTAKNVLYR